jgi:hypothetical protein
LIVDPPPTLLGSRVTRLLERRPFRVVAVAVANKMPRCLGVVGQGRQLSGACACGSGVRGLARAE